MSLLRVNTIRNKEGTGAPDLDLGINVSGVSTLGTVTISSGIVTASTGVVTYYGDGGKLDNVNEFTIGSQESTTNTVYPTFAANIGLTSVSIATTQIGYKPNSGNLGIGSTNPTVKLDVVGNANFSGIVTANRFVGSGSSLTGIVTSISSGTGLSVNQSTGNVTISLLSSYTNYWNESENASGIHTTTSVGIGTTNPQGTLQVGTGVTIFGNAGIVSATTFYGNLSGNSTSSNSATSATSSTRTNSVGINQDTTTSTELYLTYAPNFTSFQQIKADGRTNYLTYIPSTGTFNVPNINVASNITASSLELSVTGSCDGDFSVGVNAATGVILTSNGGSKYRIYVTDAGVLQTEVVI